jgi:hypothetical protein
LENRLYGTLRHVLDRCPQCPDKKIHLTGIVTQ